MYNDRKKNGSIVLYDVTVERVKGNTRKRMREIVSGS
jgi:hypothetical protein